MGEVGDTKKWRPSAAGRAEPGISPSDLCRLSQLFCDATGPTTAQDVRINQWIGWHIATATVRSALAARPTTPPTGESHE